MVVTTALCADRLAVPTAQQTRPPVTQAARSLASRIASNLQRVVPAARIHLNQTQGSTVEKPLVIASAAPAEVHEAATGPFQFRMPPPVG
jgi:hypothetical protein